MFTGSETVTDLALQLGAHGQVPGLGNVDPDGYVRLGRAAAAGDWAAAAAEQERLLRLFTIIDVADRSRIGFTAGALGAFKAAQYLRGVIDDTPVRRPAAAPDDDRDRRDPQPSSSPRASPSCGDARRWNRAPSSGLGSAHV